MQITGPSTSSSFVWTLVVKKQIHPGHCACLRRFNKSRKHIYRRLGGESDREILMAPACVILRLGSGVRIVLRGLGRGVPLGFVHMNVDEMI